MLNLPSVMVAFPHFPNPCLEKCHRIFSEKPRKIAVLKTPGRNSLCRIMYLAQLLTQGLPSGNLTVCYGKIHHF